MKCATSTGRIPAKVSVADRASVTAGFAKEVEDVNQYAPVMYAATANEVKLERVFAQPQIVATRPNVANPSLNKRPPPDLMCVDANNGGKSNIVFARATPQRAPRNCAPMYAGAHRQETPPCHASERVTAGLK